MSQQPSGRSSAVYNKTLCLLVQFVIFYYAKVKSGWNVSHYIAYQQVNVSLKDCLVCARYLYSLRIIPNWLIVDNRCYVIGV